MWLVYLGYDDEEKVDTYHLPVSKLNRSVLLCMKSKRMASHGSAGLLITKGPCTHIYTQKLKGALANLPYPANARNKALPLLVSLRGLLPSRL